MLTEPMLVAESVASDEERARLDPVSRGDGVSRRSSSRPRRASLIREHTGSGCAVSELSEARADAYGLQLGEVLETARAVTASASIAQALGVMEGVPLSMSDRVVYLRNGRPAEWRINV
jgi:DNA-binding GntR family transcriptional regulator